MLLALVAVTTPALVQDPLWDAATLELGGAEHPLVHEFAVVEPDLPVLVGVPASWRTGGARILSAVRAGRDGATLVAMLERGENGPFDDLSALRRELVGGPPDGDEPAWRLELPGHAPLDRDGAFLLAAQQPHRAVGALQHVVAIDADVLVLDGERGDLRRVDAATGQVTARLDAPWEIERGFIGPSVWSVRLCRFGDTDLDMLRWKDDPESQQRRRDARAEYEQRVAGWVVGGPIVSQDRIFVATASARPGAWMRQRADGSLLELTDRLEPLTLTTLPSPVLPQARAIDGGGVVWALTGDRVACFGSTPERVKWTLGPSSHDRRGALRWVSAPTEPVPDHFLRYRRAADPILLSDSLALRALAPYVPFDARSRVVVPIDAIDVRTGARRRMQLVVPLSAPVTEPETNFASDGRSFELITPGPVVLSDIDLVSDRRDASGRRIMLTLAVEGGSVVLGAPAAAWAELE